MDQTGEIFSYLTYNINRNFLSIPTRWAKFTRRLPLGITHGKLSAMNVNLNIKLVATGFLSIVFLSGFVLTLGSCGFGLGLGAGVLGFLLMVVAIGIFVAVTKTRRQPPNEHSYNQPISPIHWDTSTGVSFASNTVLRLADCLRYSVTL